MTSEQMTTDSGTDVASDRVDGLVNRLTLEEKIDLVHGDVDPDGIATGYVPPNERLDIPSLSLIDGPLGVRAGDGTPATGFPASIALAAAWDPELARDMGETMAAEARALDQDVLLAPGFNIVRVPQCGRLFEYYSEDPHLNSRIAVGSVEGIQAGDVAACAKHYVANNQETARMEMNANVGDRALRELYLRAFEAVVEEADVASIMAAYNHVNGTHATENRRLLTDILKDEFGFDGFVVSDWWATTDGPAAARAGLDLDMPGATLPEMAPETNVLYRTIDTLSTFEWLSPDDATELVTSIVGLESSECRVHRSEKFDDDLLQAVEDGRVDESVLDEKVRRILGQMDRFGLLEGEQPDGEIDVPAHHERSRHIAQRGTVLLQNEDDVLPLSTEDLDSMALVGPHADEPKVGGGGSSEVDPSSKIGPLDGIKYRVDGDVDVSFERGGPPVQGGDDRDVTVWNLSAETVADSVFGDDDDPADVSVAPAVEAAEDADVAVVVVQDAATEDFDRPLSLPNNQDELVSAVAEVAEETVVVLRTAGPVEMPWADEVEAIVEAWYPGQEDGRVVASILFGDAEPSGRLPVTFGERPGDYSVNTRRQHPGIDFEAEYSEGVFVGYRHFDNADIEPLFPFGHGLSYTDFEYTDVSVESGDGPTATVQVTVENVGDRDGYEVVQAYLGQDDPSVERPPKELAAFESVELAAGEETTITLSIEERDFAYYDEDGAAWTVDDGEYTVSVGRSSRNIVATETITVE
ncbi:beta-glucosidase [Halorhabdus sp. CUG00001]|uniref:beta-glucosidase family protein n=1 Tax=Halorhabdus sp. CUG00001 TaxID=2600297 RepID=UPI001E319FF0|nr:glycoside hydrolase family 3 C-terminal domain-containing protein [Halorhabdus sp. CUG00001]